MVTTVTSRHFKAHQTLVDYAEAAAKGLSRYYDGIVKCEVILSYERPRNSVKIAEVIVSVYRHRLTAIEKADEYHKSIDGAFAKAKAQIKKYKDKLRAKDRTRVRVARSKE
ncbi:MAG TPA: hypothetical protein DCP63_01450 [Bacteroidetes bacterium]|nr:hypothetical protein [Bacteroidota bacterium]